MRYRSMFVIWNLSLTDAKRDLVAFSCELVQFSLHDLVSFVKTIVAIFTMPISQTLGQTFEAVYKIMVTMIY